MNKLTDKFTLDGFSSDSERVFEGFDTGESWNGFACPKFTIEVCKQIADAILADNDPEIESFIIDEDSVIIKTFDSPNSELVYEFDSDGLCALGSYYWAWQKAE